MITKRLCEQGLIWAGEKLAIAKTTLKQMEAAGTAEDRIFWREQVRLREESVREWATAGETEETRRHGAAETRSKETATEISPEGGTPYTGSVLCCAQATVWSPGFSRRIIMELIELQGVA